jgi:YesN/AraC family two-component response regulator
MNLLNVNPFIRFARVQNKPVQHHKVIALDHRVFYCINGEGIINVNGKDYNILEGSFLFIKSGVPYINLSKKDNLVFLAFNFDFITNENNMNSPIPPAEINKFNCNMLIESVEEMERLQVPEVLYLKSFYKKEIFEEIIMEYNKKEDFFNERCSSLLKDILCCAFREISNRAVKSDRAELILSYVRKNYNKPLTNESISMKFSYHKNYINQILKKRLGKTLHQYIIEYRIEMATTLLYSKEYSVSEVADMVGFTDVYTFSKCFKRIKGFSPSKILL